MQHSGPSQASQSAEDELVASVYASETSLGKIINAARVTGTPRESHSNVGVDTRAG